MKHIIYFFALLMVVACVDNETTTEKPTVVDIPTEKNKKNIEEIKTVSVAETNRAFLGAYIGMFEAVTTKSGGSMVNKINISIDKIEGDLLYGHSIVAGNNRPFKGDFDPSGIKIEVKEPGDDKYDGVFVLNFDEERNNLSGKWIANNSKLKVNERTFELKKKK